MQIYLVGGAVRDELLKRPIEERDWVVVGSTPEELIAQHFQPVGKDFPVFLHPKTHEEYALARTERKTGKGYKGFHFYATPDVTLEEDLKRRDLTINAMAKSAEGKLIDPFGGAADLKAKWLRHVSPAFAEDPVRILRVARFASMLPEFNVHPETNALMQKMVQLGEVDALVSERVWKEWSRALTTTHPHRFFEVLSACGALEKLFPMLLNNQASFLALQQAVQLTAVPEVRFAALCHAIKQADLQALCERYRVPTYYAELATLVSRQQMVYQNLDTKNAESILTLLKNADAFRRPERFSQLMLTCRALHPESKNHMPLLHQALTAAKNVNTKPLLEKKLQGMEFAQALYQLQLDAIRHVLS